MVFKHENVIPLGHVKTTISSDVPSRFFERFGPSGEIINPMWPRVVSEESEDIFQSRDEGLRVLLINPPIREWSFPNIIYC